MIQIMLSCFQLYIETLKQLYYVINTVLSKKHVFLKAELDKKK